MLDRNRNYNTQEGAHMLADTIARYWAARGRGVRLHVVPDLTRRDGSYVVRSNMQGGRP
jgi:hypothetical protein